MDSRLEGVVLHAGVAGMPVELDCYLHNIDSDVDPLDHLHSDSISNQDPHTERDEHHNLGTHRDSDSDRDSDGDHLIIPKFYGHLAPDDFHSHVHHHSAFARERDCSRL